MERYIMNKIDEVYKKVEKIESTLADIQQVVVMTNNALAEHISNSNKEREKEDKMVKNIESQLKLFPEMFKDGGLDISNVKNISSSVEGASEKLRDVLKNYEKKFKNS